MAKITLEPSSVLRYVPMVLPPGSTLQSAPEALAALIHAVNQALGLQLLGVNEYTEGNISEDGTLPAGWNARSPDFTLKYREPSSAQTILTKIMKLGSKTQIHGILEQKEDTASTDITTAEFVSATFFHLDRDVSEPLVHGYVSSDRVAELITKYIKDVLTPLFPNMDLQPRERSSSPYVAVHPTLSRSDSQGSPPRSDERPGPSRLLDDRENNEKPPSLHQPFQLPQRQHDPFEIGRSDLDPIPNPFAGKSPIQPLNPGGGMYVGPGHPIFGQGRGPQPGVGPWGGDGFLPPMGAPPGARFDPVGPFGPMRGGAGIGGFPGRGGRPPAGPFSGEPDNDEFLPPRFGGGSGGGGFGDSHDNMYM